MYTMCFYSIEIAKRVFVIFDNIFHVYLMSGLQKMQFFFSRWLFFKSTLSVLRCTWTGRINLKIIRYPKIWPFMRHPWFPTRKASNLTFFCFQLQLLNICIFLQSTHQVDMKNVVKCCKHYSSITFFWLWGHCVLPA